MKNPMKRRLLHRRAEVVAPSSSPLLVEDENLETDERNDDVGEDKVLHLELRDDDDNDGIPEPPRFTSLGVEDIDCRHHTDSTFIKAPYDSEDDSFEQMTIQVRIYSLTGILLRTNLCYNASPLSKPKVGALSTHLDRKDQRKNPSSAAWETSSFVTNTSRIFPIAKSKRMLFNTRESPKSDKESVESTVPTTAVVSIQSEIRNGFSMETFLPSMTLKLESHSNCKEERSKNASKIQHCRAFWSNDSCMALLATDDNCDLTNSEPSIFELSRIMHREKYRRDTAIGQLSSFIHERLDLKVCVGRGTELIPLGIASLTVTGDEEGEVICNVPVNPARPHDFVGNTMAKCLMKNNRKFKNKSGELCFSNDSRNLYSLEENATLRVGLRVIPTKIKIESDLCCRKLKKWTLKESTTFKTKTESDGILSSQNCSGQPELYIEVNDENSLIKNLIRTEPTFDKNYKISINEYFASHDNHSDSKDVFDHDNFVHGKGDDNDDDDDDDDDNNNDDNDDNDDVDDDDEDDDDDDTSNGFPRPRTDFTRYSNNSFTSSNHRHWYQNYHNPSRTTSLLSPLSTGDQAGFFCGAVGVARDLRLCRGYEAEDVNDEFDEIYKGQQNSGSFALIPHKPAVIVNSLLQEDGTSLNSISVPESCLKASSEQKVSKGIRSKITTARLFTLSIISDMSENSLNESDDDDDDTATGFYNEVFHPLRAAL